MAYLTLEKAFYADTSSERHANHAALYASRFNADSTIRTGIHLKNGELFCASPVELMLSSELIFKKEKSIISLWESLPHIAQGAFIRSLILDEVVSSNAIEGVHSTRRQIEAALEKTASSCDAHTPFLEFAKLYLGLCDTCTLPTKPRDVRVIFDAVVDGSLSQDAKPDGVLFRNEAVHIEDSRGKKIHAGVVPEEQINRYIVQMLELNLQENVPSLIAAVLGHFVFEYVHPFYDGNGRTGRYLLALYLSKILSQATVLSLSRTIAENKSAYYKGFDLVERPLNCSEATPFIEMFFNLITQAQEGVITSLQRKKWQLGELEQAISRISDTMSVRHVEALRYVGHMHLFEAFGETTLIGLTEYLGTSKATASACLSDFAERGLLQKISARPLVYCLSEQGISELGLAVS